MPPGEQRRLRSTSTDISTPFEDWDNTQPVSILSSIPPLHPDLDHRLPVFWRNIFGLDNDHPVEDNPSHTLLVPRIRAEFHPALGASRPTLSVQVVDDTLALLDGDV